MNADRGKVRPACAICGARVNVEWHHVGGRNHLFWLTAPLCLTHHNRLHLLLQRAGVDLKYTADPVERLIRATKAISIFMCMVQDALHKARR
jgi:hypothetical protein